MARRCAHAPGATHIPVNKMADHLDSLLMTERTSDAYQVFGSTVLSNPRHLSRDLWNYQPYSIKKNLDLFNDKYDIWKLVLLLLIFYLIWNLLFWLMPPCLINCLPISHWCTNSCLNLRYFWLLVNLDECGIFFFIYSSFNLLNESLSTMTKKLYLFHVNR